MSHTCKVCKQEFSADEFHVGAALCDGCYEAHETLIDIPAETTPYSAAEGIVDDSKQYDFGANGLLNEIEVKQEESQEELWRDIIDIVEVGQFLSTKYKEVTDKLKSKYTITKK